MALSEAAPTQGNWARPIDLRSPRVVAMRSDPAVLEHDSRLIILKRLVALNRGRPNAAGGRGGWARRQRENRLRSTNQTFAGRSASRRMYQGNHAAP